MSETILWTFVTISYFVSDYSWSVICTSSDWSRTFAKSVKSNNKWLIIAVASSIGHFHFNKSEKNILVHYTYRSDSNYQYCAFKTLHFRFSVSRMTGFWLWKEVADKRTRYHAQRDTEILFSRFFFFHFIIFFRISCRPRNTDVNVFEEFRHVDQSHGNDFVTFGRSNLNLINSKAARKGEMMGKESERNGWKSERNLYKK